MGNFPGPATLLTGSEPERAAGILPAGFARLGSADKMPAARFVSWDGIWLPGSGIDVLQ